MTVYILDPGLQSYIGHHANTASSIAKELRDRGWPVRILGHKHLSVDVAATIGAEPFFSFGTYDTVGDDPVCGSLETLLYGGAATSGDLGRIAPLPGDILVWTTARPLHLIAMGELLRSAPSSILSVFTAGFPCVEPESTYWRFGCRRLPPDSPVVFAATAGLMAADYSAAVGRAFQVAPNLHQGRFRDRSNAGPLVIGVLGHQRPTKGTQLLPWVIRWTRRDVQWLVHDSGNSAEAILKSIETQPNVRVVRSASADWQELLDACDALVMPYSRTEYDRMHSGMVAEAVACGIPFVIPGTPALIEQAGQAGYIAYRGDGPDSVTMAVEALLDNFKELAWRARAAADLYAAENGPARWVDWLLANAAAAGISKIA